MNSKGYVIAMFPELPGGNSPETCSSYMHVGQHGAAALGLITDTYPTDPHEYADLLAELQSLGYDLEIVKRFTPAHRASRIAALK